jgi:hypothetical protein
MLTESEQIAAEEYRISKHPSILMIAIRSLGLYAFSQSTYVAYITGWGANEYPMEIYPLDITVSSYTAFMLNTSAAIALSLAPVYLEKHGNEIPSRTSTNNDNLI